MRNILFLIFQIWIAYSSKANECLEILENRVDVLINNAGTGFRRNIEDLNADDFLTIYKTNVFGLSLLTKEITTCMKHNKYGTIIILAPQQV
ncbi:MAG: hypothetical protein CM15mP112_07480 [Flavobacteriales bacterium]|nr:MAG: hypothetical protein CM15mP112_07480 [Flavobacteriales bacterium]